MLSIHVIQKTHFPPIIEGEKLTFKKRFWEKHIREIEKDHDASNGCIGGFVGKS